MAECFKCGIGEDKVRLFDGIAGKGIIKICKNCYFIEKIPLLNKPESFEKEGSGTPRKADTGVYEKLSHMSGFDPKTIDAVRRVDTLRDQETTLKDIVDKNFEKTFSPRPNPREDMISNFHWIIMRRRRSKKLTQKDLAREIGENEATIKMAEQGILPKDDFKLINKLESFLNVRITKDTKLLGAERPIREIPKRDLGFDSTTTKSLTISDLHGMNEKGEDYVPRAPEEDFEEELQIEEDDEVEFSSEDDDNLIFGR